MSSLDTFILFAPLLTVVSILAFGFGYSIRTQSRI